MITSLIAAELLRFGIRNLKDVKLDDVERVARSLGVIKPAVLIGPSLGLLGVGIAIGAGVGMLAAPCAGKELRERLSKMIRDKMPASVSKGVNGTHDARTASPAATPGISSV